MKITIILLIFITTSFTSFSQVSDELLIAQKIKVIDTDFSKGRLNNIQEINLQDVVKFHGHLCDGLVLGFLELTEALYKLYPDSIIDRTNTRIISKSSPCFTDVAIYTTGGRYQFNTFYVDDSIKYHYIVQRIDNGLTYGVKPIKNLVPSKIIEMGKLAINQKLDECQIDELKVLEDEFSVKLLTSKTADFVELSTIENFKWNNKMDKTFIKTDILNKNKNKCKK